MKSRAADGTRGTAIKELAKTQSKLGTKPRVK